MDAPDWSTLDPGGERALPDPGFPPRAWNTGLWAAGKGDRDALELVLDDIVFLGGSHAQREVFEDTVIAAAMRAGRQDEAAQVLERRLARRHWRRDARLLASARVRTSPETDGPPGVGDATSFGPPRHRPDRGNGD